MTLQSGVFFPLTNYMHISFTHSFYKVGLLRPSWFDHCDDIWGSYLKISRSFYFPSKAKCFRKNLLTDPCWLRQITTNPLILALANTGCLDDRYPKLKMYISELTLDIHEYIPAAQLPMYDLNLIKMIVSRFVGTESFFNI